MVNISVIIPTLNEEGYIEKTLSALKPQLKKGDEIIVVDSYSTDNTVKTARKFGAKVIFIPRCGIGPAKTFGAKKAKNEIIAMLDADGQPMPRWVNQIKSIFENSKIDAVDGLNYYEAPSLARRYVYNIVERIVFEIGRLNYRINHVFWMSINNCAIKKDIFLKQDGLRNVVCEDFDFANRTKGLIKGLYDPKLNVILSDRRFKKHGFLKTYLGWAKSDLSILMKKNNTAATDYEIVR